MDQREWDYGARMSRDRRAAEAWPTREPEASEPESRWASLADTGSLAPSEEALTWQRRADAWAQQAEVEPYGGGSQAVEPANRWSEVASTGRPTFPADGVGWRTQTSEWQSTGARWRQTTEWRSSTGSHVWRSTTEAWRSADDFTPEREKPAITGTAWPTPEVDSGTEDIRDSIDTPSQSSWQQSSPPSWQQSSTPTWQQPSTQTPSWQEPATQAPSWQEPATQAPSWQEPATQAPSWQQQPAAQAPSWQRSEPEEPPSWRRAEEPGRATRPVEQTWSGDAPATTASWQQSSAPAPSWQRPTGSWRGDEQPPGENTVGIPRWERTDAPGWQTSPVEDAQHLVRQDDRAAWQRDAGYTERPQRGRRRAPEIEATPSGGTGWSSGSESAESWARHTDTGNIAAGPAQPTWAARSEAPSRSGGRRSRRDDTTSYSEPTSAAPAGYPGSPAESTDQPRRGRQNRYNANASDWREDTASWEAEPDTSNWTRDPDTGQWSRAEDDPRVLAWREEAARREAMKAAGEEDPPPSRRSRREENRPRRADPPSGGVPGGPLPSSGVPGSPVSGPAWPASGVPNDARIGVPSARPGSAMPSARPRSAMPGAPGAYEQEDRGHRYRDDAAALPPAGGGRRRAPEPPGPQAWQAAPEPRPSRQSRRQNPGPEDQPTDGWRQGPLPPRQEPPRDVPRQGFGALRELPAGGSQRPDTGRPARELPADGTQWPTGRPARELPAGGPSWADPEPRRPYQDAPPSRSGQVPRPPSGGPAWADRETRQPYRDPAPARELPPGGPSWDAQEPRRPGYGAPRELPAGGPPRPGTGRPARALPPGGPAWSDPEPRRPDYGAQRELPAGGPSWQEPRRPQPGGGPGWTEPGGGPGWTEPSGGPGWAEPGPQDPYGGQWPDPLSQPRRASAPVYGASDSQTHLQRGYDDRDDPPTGGGFGPAQEPGDWLAAERAARRGPQYRDGAGQDGETDWRQELSRDNALTESEARRYDTSDFPPFRPSGSATVDGSSNLALSATSVISRVPQAPDRLDEPEEDTTWPPRRPTGAFQGTGSYERRPVTDGVMTSRSNDLLNPDDDEEDEETAGGPLAAVGYTVVWYGVPVVLFVLGIFLLNTGERSQALNTLADAAPEFAVSLALSMLVALCLRWATAAWKSASVGLAAAVVGGGLATVLSSAITGNSLS